MYFRRYVHFAERSGISTCFLFFARSEPRRGSVVLLLLNPLPSPQPYPDPRRQRWLLERNRWVNLLLNEAAWEAE